MIHGTEFAESYGYSLTTASPNKDGDYNGTFVKGDLHLKIYKRGDEIVGTLSKFILSIECKIGEFAIPNKNFEVFEDMLNRIIYKDD